ncbi:MAG: hypothetical protein AAGA97_00750 [Pseudomonadota bacterium]
MKKLLNLSDPDVSLEAALTSCEQISERLNRLSSTIGPSFQSLQFYTRLRTKSRESIEEKTTRKKSKDERGASYTFHEMTDLVGFRVVTLYDFQLPEAQQFVLSLVEAGQNLPQGLFFGNKMSEAFHEAKYYTPRDDQDYTTCRENLLKALKRQYDEHPEQHANPVLIETASEKLYSSGHLIFNAISHQDGYCLTVPVEFQIRSAVEDIWAEVNHKQMYKIRDHYVWNSEFENLHKRSERRSDKLKESILNLSGMMREFSDLSNKTRRSLESFDTINLEEYAEKSFGISLILRAANNELNNSVSIEVPNYCDALTELVESKHSSEEAASAYRKCWDSLRKLKGKLEDLEQEIRGELEGLDDDSKHESEVKLKAYHQYWLLFELEQLRVRAHAITEDFCINSDLVQSLEELSTNLNKNGDFTGEHVAKLRAEECRRIYSEFCKLIDSDKLKIKPLAMIHFWKHLLASQFNKQLSDINVGKAYNLLQRDRTVQKSSIYKSIIPRALAGHYFSQASDVVQSFSGDISSLYNPVRIGKDVPSLRTSLSEQLNEAIKLSVEAYKADLERDGNRGDFRLGSHLFEENPDIDLIKKCMELSLTQLDVEIPDPKTPLANAVQKLLQ